MQIVGNSQNQINFKSHLILSSATLSNINKHASLQERDIFRSSLPALKKIGGDDVFHTIKYYPNRKSKDGNFILKTTSEGSKIPLCSEPISSSSLLETAQNFLITA